MANAKEQYLRENVAPILRPLLVKAVQDQPKDFKAWLTAQLEADAGLSQALKDKVNAAGQGQLLKFVGNDLCNERELAAKISTLDFDRIAKLFKDAMEHDAHPPAAGDLQPLDNFDSMLTAPDSDKEMWTNAGLDAYAKGEIALLVLSGGQGTRLGFAGPKGMYDIGLPSKKTLFHMFAERILSIKRIVKERSGKDIKIPWYIMTSPMNHKVTVEYFESMSHFGIPKADVVFFPQGTLPCLTDEKSPLGPGKVMLETPSEFGKASDGNGGIYAALKNSGSLSDMKKGGIKYVHVFAVDNAICKVGDPTFMGYCISQGADCGNKVVWKANWDESVGVVAKRGGKYTVVEYSEITDEQAQQKDGNGKLVYGAGNICNHFYTLDLLERVTDDVLIFHVARKAIPYAGDDGKTIKPAKKDKNGIKLECFIFDAFCLSKKMAVLEASREDEFSPVKNAPGDPTDSPDSAREMISQQCRKWAADAGATVNVDGLFEISPMVSFKGEGLESLKDKTLTENLIDSV